MPPNRQSCPHCQAPLLVEQGPVAVLRQCPRCRKPLVSAATPVPRATATVLALDPLPAGWFYARDRKKYGPVPLAQLRQLARAGQLRAGDMVLCEGTARWQPAGSLPGLFPSNDAAAPPAGWYYVRERNKVGPVTLAQLRLLVVAGQLRHSDMVLKEGSDRWQSVESLPGLFPAPAPSNGTPAPVRTGWYYVRDKKKTGPVALNDLRRLAGAGTLRAADMVLPEGATTWQTAGSVTDLFPPKPATPPEPLPPGWYYAQGKKRVGPLALEQLQQLVAFGFLRATDMVLPQGSAKWQPVAALSDQLAPAPPPPPPAPAPSGWHYIQDRKKHGPVSREELGQLATTNRLHPADMVLPEGSTKWAAADTIEGLFALRPVPVNDAGTSAVFPEKPSAPGPRLVDPALADAGTSAVFPEAPSRLRPPETDVQEPLPTILAEDTARPRTPAPEDSFIPDLSAYENHNSSALGEDAPAPTVFDSFIGGILKEKPLPPPPKPRLRPGGARPCPHCHGTAYCGRTWDSAGMLECGPACDTCREKFGLARGAEAAKVTCAVCQGKGCTTEETSEETWRADAVAWRLRGLAASDSGDYEQAIAAFTAALEVEPDYADAYYDRGWACIAAGQAEEGEADLAEAARLSPKYAGPPSPPEKTPRRWFGWLTRQEP